MNRCEPGECDSKVVAAELISAAAFDRADLAEGARERRLALVDRAYRSTGRVIEKYDVVDLDHPVAGDGYPTQDGYG